MLQTWRQQRERGVGSCSPTGKIECRQGLGRGSIQVPGVLLVLGVAVAAVVVAVVVVVVDEGAVVVADAVVEAAVAVVVLEMEEGATELPAGSPD